MANFSDLPYEIHRLILQLLIGNDATNLRADIRALASLNRAWRSLVRKKAFRLVELRSEALPQFRELVRGDPTILEFMESLRVNHATGYSRATDVLDEDVRFAAFCKTFATVQRILEMAGEEVKMPYLLVSMRDMVMGAFNGDHHPVFKSTPAVLSNVQRSRLEVLLASPPPITKLKFSTRVLENLEMNWEALAIVIKSMKTLTNLRLHTTDARCSRYLRREVYEGLLNVVKDLADPSTGTCPALRVFKLMYPSSYGTENDGVAGKAYTPAPPGDPLSLQLGSLCRRLTNFFYTGRISHHLFEIFEPNCWPCLEEADICFESVDSYGDFLMRRPGLSELKRGKACCYNGTYLPKLDIPKEQSEEPDYVKLESQAVDFVYCEKCKDRPLARILADLEKIDRLFRPASLAMREMPRLKWFRFASSNDFVYFSFRRINYYVRIGENWQPAKDSLKIWEERFPSIKYKKMIRKAAR